MSQDNLHASHKKHRNALYSLVVILAILQTVSFIVISMQVSKLSIKIDDEVKRTANELKQYSSNLMKAYDSVYQENFNQISSALIRQQKDFSEEIKKLKSARADFSGIVEEVVRGVVTIRTEDSIGTGFFINPRGYIVTNYHVIRGNEDAIEAVSYDRKVYRANFIGKDEERDLALLLVPGNFDSIELASRSEIQVGKKVIAIGNPLGLSFTVTEGIISGIDRVGPSGLAEYVQTDVSLNPGNSGGPLVDTNGRAVGINNFKIGGAEALGFSLASPIIKKQVNKIANQTIVP